jgi:hypothetical protein
MRQTTILPLLIVLLLLIPPEQAQGSISIGHVMEAGRPAAATAGYGLVWWTVDGGGGVSDGGTGYTLMGVIGQPDAEVLSGEGYVVGGGFWGGTGPVSAALEHAVYLPCLLRGFASVSP